MKTTKEICDFLRSRDVSPAVISAFEMNKIDAKVMQLLNDNQLKDMGLKALGDIYILRDFCLEQDTEDITDAFPSTSSAPYGQDSTTRRERIIDLISRVGTTRSRSEANRRPQRENIRRIGRPKMGIRCISFALHLATGLENGQRQSRRVKSPLGDKNFIGMKIVTSVEYDTLLEDVISAFFPEGSNPIIGDATGYNFEIVNSRNDCVSDIMGGQFTVETYVKKQKIPGAIRLYLLCTSKSDQLDDPDSDTESKDDPADDPNWLPDLSNDGNFTEASPSGEVLLRVHPTRSQHLMTSLPVLSEAPSRAAQSAVVLSAPQQNAAQSNSLSPVPSISAVPSTSSFYQRQMLYSDIIDVSDEEDDADLNVAIQASLEDQIHESSILEETLDVLLLQLQTVVDQDANPNLINVIRGNLLDGARRAVLRDRFKPAHPLSVKFMDDMGTAEGAVDEGGPKREFFTMVMHELQINGIFAGSETAKMIVPHQPGIEKDMYYVCGVLLALGLTHVGEGPHFFSETLYDIITKGWAVVTLSLEDVHPEDIRRMLKKINDASTLEELYSALGEATTFLEIAGCLTPVRCLADKDRIVKAATQFQVVHRSRHCIDRFEVGLSTLGVLNKIKENPVAFKELFCFQARILTSTSLRDLFQPVLSETGTNHRTDEVATLAFWNDYIIDVEDGKCQTSLKDILVFATGAEVVPPLGFNPQPSLHFHGEGKLPLASTCDCQLRLPRQRMEYEEFSNNMDFGILNSPGFGRA